MERKIHMDMVKAWLEKTGYDSATGYLTRQTCERLNIGEVVTRLMKDSPYKKWDGPPLRNSNQYPKGGKRFNT
jgi:hypothetical protein